MFVNVLPFFKQSNSYHLTPTRKKKNLILIAIFTNIFQAFFARILDKKGKKKKRIINYIYSTFIKRKIIGRIDGRERERKERRVKSWTEMGWDIRLGKLVVYARAGAYVDTGGCVYNVCFLKRCTIGIAGRLADRNNICKVGRDHCFPATRFYPPDAHRLTLISTF